MDKINWKQKLTSRKFWLAVAGFIAGLVIAFNGSAEVAETVSGCILSGGSVVALILGEGLVDAARAKNEIVLIEDSEHEETEEKAGI